VSFYKLPHPWPTFLVCREIQPWNLDAANLPQTRVLNFAIDGKTLFVAIRAGSASERLDAHRWPR
jgi:hypothetical protein